MTRQYLTTWTSEITTPYPGIVSLLVQAIYTPAEYHNFASTIVEKYLGDPPLYHNVELNGKLLDNLLMKFRSYIFCCALQSYPLKSEVLGAVLKDVRESSQGAEGKLIDMLQKLKLYGMLKSTYDSASEVNYRLVLVLARDLLREFLGLGRTENEPTFDPLHREKFSHTDPQDGANIFHWMNVARIQNYSSITHANRVCAETGQIVPTSAIKYCGFHFPPLRLVSFCCVGFESVLCEMAAGCNVEQIQSILEKLKFPIPGKYLSLESATYIKGTKKKLRDEPLHICADQNSVLFFMLRLVLQTPQRAGCAVRVDPEFSHLLQRETQSRQHKQGKLEIPAQQSTFRNENTTVQDYRTNSCTLPLHSSHPIPVAAGCEITREVGRTAQHSHLEERTPEFGPNYRPNYNRDLDPLLQLEPLKEGLNSMRIKMEEQGFRIAQQLQQMRDEFQKQKLEVEIQMGNVDKSRRDMEKGQQELLSNKIAMENQNGKLKQRILEYEAKLLGYEDRLVQKELQHDNLSNEVKELRQQISVLQHRSERAKVAENTEPSSTAKQVPTTKQRPLVSPLRYSLWKKFFTGLEGVCPICENGFTIQNWEAGHVISKANGGSDDLGNLVPICFGCNRSMGKTNMPEWVRTNFPSRYRVIFSGTKWESG